MCIQQERRRSLGQFLFCVVMVLSATGIALDSPAAEPQTAVLALYGSRPDLPSNAIVDQILRSTLERELGSRLDFYTEFLDTARWPEGEAQATVHDFLRRRYAQIKLSAIIAVARPAINFMRIYGDELFPGVPIIVYGDSDAMRDWKPGRPVTGTLAKIDLSRTVELILRLQPETREILVISGASASDRLRLSDTRRQLGPLEKRVKLTYMDSGSEQDFVRTAARVPDGTVILFLSVYQDSAGNKLLNHEVLARIAKEAGVPVYNQTATHVGLGIVGGVVFDPETLGRETAQLTLRVLQGEGLQNLPVQESKSTVPMVDWRQLRRWGLDEKRLPAGTIVRFRELSVWQSHKWYIIGATFLVFAEALLIITLLWQRVRRRTAETQLAMTYERLRMALESGRFVGWDCDLNTGSNRWFGDLEGMFGIQSDNYPAPIDEFRRRVYPEDLEKVLKTIESAKERKEPYLCEFRVVHNDGSIRWIIARGQFHYRSNGEAERMLGLALDITARKAAEEALASVSGRLIQAQEQERTRIARELHDDINQRLATLQIDLDRIRQHPPATDAELQVRVRELSGRLSETSFEVQGISHRLHSSKLEYLGLVAACRGFCAELGERQGIQVDFAAGDVPRTLPQEVSLTVFRVLQESLQNATKYSGSQRFEVQLRGNEKEVQLTVRDHGKGFDVEAALNGNGLGLISMRERVTLVKGTIAIRSNRHRGTEVDLHVPIVSAADEITEARSGAA